MTGQRAVKAAELEVDHGIAFADAIARELTMGSPDRILLTADDGFEPVAMLAKIEFLANK